jgi:hypothetical protein
LNRYPGPIALALLLLTSLAFAADSAEYRVVEPPKSLELSPFYKKCVLVDGLPIVASEKVSDYAMKEAAYLIGEMLQGRRDVTEALVKNKVRVAIMAASERTCDIPEHSDLKPSSYWNRRARGLGATPARPATSCGEENLLGYPGDPYQAENILIHEFAHTIHDMGLASIDPKFDDRLEKIYQAALAKGLWKGKYAATNRHEYWAEAVQSWFDTNRPPDHDHNDVDTREELQAYDPEIAALIDESFPNKAYRYVRPDQRKTPGHLQGYDPKHAPNFAWTPEEKAASLKKDPE